jgi:zinc resistance-associated protein
MWKKALMGATALVIAGSAFVYAQQRPGMMPGGSEMHGMMRGGPGGFGGWHASAEDMSAFVDARIAALRAGLRLNPDQEKTWPAFEQAARDFGKMRIDRFAARRDQQPAADPIERLHRRADALTTRGTALKRLADAAAPLYQSLDEAQKRRFAMLARFMRSQHPGMWRGEHREHGGFRDDGSRGFRGDDGRGRMPMHRGDDDGDRL